MLYLIFNEGYAASTGPHVARADLTAEAIRLTRALHAALPDDAEVAGLLALMLLTDARRPARTGPGGELVPLAEQDRTLWDRALIAEGIALLSAALPRRAVGEYQLQAADRRRPRRGRHRRARPTGRRSSPCTRLLERMTGNPMVTLNRAVAVAMVRRSGRRAGRCSPTSTPRLAGHHRLDAVRAHLLEMAGDADAAPSRTTCAPPAAPPASPSATTSPPRPRACASGGPDGAARSYTRWAPTPLPRRRGSSFRRHGTPYGPRLGVRHFARKPPEAIMSTASRKLQRRRRGTDATERADRRGAGGRRQGGQVHCAAGLALVAVG